MSLLHGCSRSSPAGDRSQVGGRSTQTAEGRPAIQRPTDAAAEPPVQAAARAGGSSRQPAVWGHGRVAERAAVELQEVVGAADELPGRSSRNTTLHWAPAGRRASRATRGFQPHWASRRRRRLRWSSRAPLHGERRTGAVGVPARGAAATDRRSSRVVGCGDSYVTVARRRRTSAPRGAWSTMPGW